MKIIIAGAGAVGTHLARLLSKENLDVVLIDPDEDKLSKVNSLTSIGSQGMIPIASVLAGVILEAFGSTALLTFCSLGFAVTAISLLFSRQFREL